MVKKARNYTFCFRPCVFLHRFYYDVVYFCWSSDIRNWFRMDLYGPNLGQESGLHIADWPTLVFCALALHIHIIYKNIWAGVD